MTSYNFPCYFHVSPSIGVPWSTQCPARDNGEEVFLSLKWIPIPPMGRLDALISRAAMPQLRPEAIESAMAT